MISKEERALASLAGLRKRVVDDHGDMLLNALETKIKEHPTHRWRVYNNEVYGADKEMSVSLKRAGDAVMRLSEGFIVRGFDKGKGFHYVEVQNQ